jgi:polysaccharide biosynthesis transport protein
VLRVQPHSPFDLSLVWALLWRAIRRPSFILIFLMGMGATAFLVMRSRPVYRSETVLLYQDRSGSNPVAVQRGESMSPRRVGLTLQDMLFSRTSLEKLIKEFGLYEKMVARFGMVAATEEMQKHDLHFSTREGYTFRLSFDSTSPEVAQGVTARATDLLVRAHVDARLEEIKEMERFLDGEKRRVEKELHDRESEFALFVAKNPVVLELGTGRSTLGLESTGAETASLSLEMQALQLRERLSQLRLQPSPTAQTARPAAPRELSEARLRAEAELAAAQRELAEKQMQFTEEHPDVKRAMVRVGSAKSRLRQLEEASVAAVPSGTDNQNFQIPGSVAGADSGEMRLLQQQIELLEKQKRAVRSRGRITPLRTGAGDPDQLGRLRAQYVELERRTRESREHLALLEDRQFQAEMQSLFTAQSRRADLVVVDPAFKPTVPLRSPRKKVLAIGSAVTLLIALVIGILLAIKDDRLRQAADLKRFDLPPLLCEIPPP